MTIALTHGRKADILLEKLLSRKNHGDVENWEDNCSYLLIGPSGAMFPAV